MKFKFSDRYLKMINYLKFNKEISNQFVVERSLLAMFLTTQMTPDDQKILIELFQKYEDELFTRQAKH